MDIRGNSRIFARKIAKQKENCMVRGVEKVTLPHRKRLSAYERSLRDLEEGRVYEAKDVDDLFKQCLEK